MNNFSLASPQLYIAMCICLCLQTHEKHTQSPLISIWYIPTGKERENNLRGQTQAAYGFISNLNKPSSPSHLIHTQSSITLSNLESANFSKPFAEHFWARGSISCLVSSSMSSLISVPSALVFIHGVHPACFTNFAIPSTHSTL